MTSSSLPQSLFTLLIAGLVLLMGALTACEKPQSDNQAGVLVVASIAPVAGIVQPLLPDSFSLSTLVPVGASAHGFELTPGDLKTLAECQLVIAVGLGLEPRLDQTLRTHRAQGRREIHLAELLNLTEMSTHEVEGEHEAHAEHDHSHSSVDPHVWLDPELVRQVVPVLADALVELVPEDDQYSRQQIRDRTRDFLNEVKAFEAECVQRLAPFKGAAIITQHAAYSRFAERFGLRVVSVLHDNSNSEQTPGQLAQAARAMRDQNVQGIFTEPGADPSQVQSLAKAAKIKFGTLDPLGQGDWLAMMHANLDQLVRVLKANGS